MQDKSLARSGPEKNGESDRCCSHAGVKGRDGAGCFEAAEGCKSNQQLKLTHARGGGAQKRGLVIFDADFSVAHGQSLAYCI